MEHCASASSSSSLSLSLYSLETNKHEQPLLPATRGRRDAKYLMHTSRPQRSLPQQKTDGSNAMRSHRALAVACVASDSFRTRLLKLCVETFSAAISHTNIQCFPFPIHPIESAALAPP